MRPLICIFRPIGLCLAFSLFCSQFARADDYPSKPVTLVVPFAPGGTAELVARVLAQAMEKPLGATIVVYSRPGAGGNIGAAYVAQSSPTDGYTILLGSSSLASNPSLMKMTFDPQKELAPVAGLCVVPNIVLVSANSPYKSLADLVSAARAAPNKLSFGSSGIGTSSHLAGELLKTATGIQILHVPYKGSGAVYPDLIGMRVDMLFDLQGSALNNVQGGLVRPLATTASRRSSSMPNVPTVAELGYPNYENGSWLGLMVRTGTPPEIIAKIERAAQVALQDPAIKSRFKQIGAEAIPVPSAEFGAYVKADAERWNKVAKENHWVLLQ